MIEPQPKKQTITILYKSGTREKVEVISFMIAEGWLKLSTGETTLRYINQDLIKEFSVE